MADDTTSDPTPLTPLNPQFVVTSAQQLTLIMSLCRELGYDDGWMSGYTRNPLWRSAILYHRKHKKSFDKLFTTPTVAFLKPSGITYINACLAEAGIAQVLVGTVSGAHFEGNS